MVGVEGFVAKRLDALKRLDVFRDLVGYRGIIDLLRSAYLLNVVVVACRLGLFDLFTELRDVEEVARSLGVDERLLRVLCRVLVYLGLLREVDGKFVDSEVSRTYLATSSPYSLVTYLLFHSEKLLRERYWVSMLNALKGMRRVGEYSWIGVDAVVSMEIALSLSWLRRTIEVLKGLEDMRKARKVLDLGCSTGLYAALIAKEFPHLEVYALDLPHVVQSVTRRIVEMLGVGNRVRLVPADFTKDDIGSDYDVILDIGAVSPLDMGMLERVAKALSDGGVLVSRHVFLDNDMKGPLPALLSTLLEYVELGKRLTATIGGRAEPREGRATNREGNRYRCGIRR